MDGLETVSKFCFLYNENSGQKWIKWINQLLFPQKSSENLSDYFTGE